MKIKFGINFEFKITRDMPEQAHDHDSEVASLVERSPDTDWTPPRARRVVGFQARPPEAPHG
jgi:hypothetical protein